MKSIYIAHPFGGEQAERIVEKERYRGGTTMNELSQAIADEKHTFTFTFREVIK